MHISKVEPKTAENILTVADELGNDWYINNILRAAAKLAEDGKQSYEYGGQWASGTTWWVNGDNPAISINAENEAQ